MKAPSTEIVRLPQHTVVRSLIDNREMQERLSKLKPTPYEFFKVDIGDGVQLDGWMIKPPDFDPQKALSGFVLCLHRTMGANRG